MARNEKLTELELLERQMRQTFKVANDSAGLIEKNIGTRAAYAINHPIKTADDLIRVLEDIVGTTERFTRAQQYIGAKKAATKTGKGIEYAESEALKSSKKNTANFQDQGEFGAVMRMWSPYLAAGIQGVRSTAGALKRRPSNKSCDITFLCSCW